MKIALVHEMLVKLGGAERVLRSFCDLFPGAPIHTLFHDKKATADWFKRQKIHPSRLQKYYQWGIPPKFLLPRMPRAVEEWRFDNCDAVISSSSAFVHGIKTPKSVKHICYCHSPMRYAWDYTHEYTKPCSSLMKWWIARMLTPIRQWDYRAAERPDVLLANSRHVQKRIAKYWRRSSEVLYPPVDIKRFRAAAGGENYFLIVSALTPFKRIDLAVRAFRKLKHRLVIIGEGTQRRFLEQMAPKNVEFLGYQGDQVVRKYMENCRAFIFPGEEDFGITPVEAMAAGKPVLAYGVGGVTESVQEGVSGEFFHKQSPDSLLNGLKRLMMNESRYDYKKIRAIAERFDKVVFADRMKKCINTL